MPSAPVAVPTCGGAIGAAAYGAVMYLIRDVINEIFIAKDEAMLRVLPPMVVGLFLLVGAGRYLQVYELQWVGLDIVRRLRDRLLGHVLDREVEVVRQVDIARHRTISGLFAGMGFEEWRAKRRPARNSRFEIISALLPSWGLSVRSVRQV